MLVRQIPWGITFAYDVHLGCLRNHYKGITKDNNREKYLHQSFYYDVP